MTKPLEEYNKEELIQLVNTLKKQKKFGLVWEDKPEKVAQECEEKLPVLNEVEEKAIQETPDEPTNIMIEGDNYHALSALNYTHAGKIDVIYIDPPYNTGNKDFIYNDNYVDKEDTFRHSKWLSFMEKRLKLAKNLLTDDGVIFISIDDNEQAHLQLLCNQVFGDNNHLATIATVNNLSGRSDADFFATAHESLLVYGKNRSDASIMGLPMPESSEKTYRLKDNISRYKEVSLQKTGKNNRRIDRPNMYFPIYYRESDKKFSLENFDGALEIYPTPINNVDGRWRWGRETFDKNKNTELTARCVNGVWRVYVKMRDVINGEKRTIKPKTIWLDPKYDTGSGGRMVNTILNNQASFTNPKPLEYIKDIVRISAKHTDIVLDFFAGSGTTGQAVMELNKEDGGHRHFILVTNNEGDGKDDAGEDGIAEKVTYPRIKTVITGIRPDGSKYSDGIPANVRYFKTDFVEKGRSVDSTREKLVGRASDLIRVRENTFDTVLDKPLFKLFSNKEKLTAIIFDPFKIQEIWQEIESVNKDNLPIRLYIFSYSSDTSAFTDEIPSDTKMKWESVPIPESILKVYKRIFRDRSKK